MNILIYNLYFNSYYIQPTLKENLTLKINLFTSKVKKSNFKDTYILIILETKSLLFLEN